MNPFISILGISCSMSQPEVKTANPPPPQTELKSEQSDDGNDAQEPPAENGPNDSTISVSAEQVDTRGRSLRTMNPPPTRIEPPVPPPEKLLPGWDEVPVPEDLPPGTPTAGLAISSDHAACYKEWFAERSVHPHVRRYGGRILMTGEESTGTRISCNQDEKTTLLNKLQEAGILPGTP